MGWFWFTVISLLGWGCADLFYKKGTDTDDRQSHLKIAVWVGLVMGAASFVMLPFSETGFSVYSFFENVLKYSPASICYIASMIIGYAGLRYLEISIISPVQNASGGLSVIFMCVYFAVIGKASRISEAFSSLDIAATAMIVIGTVMLAVTEHRISNNAGEYSGSDPGRKKYRLGALALIFPVLYCVFDTLGTAADGIILDSEVGLGLGEIDVLILYGLTFFAVGVVCWFILCFTRKKPYNPFAKSEKSKGLAACCEEFGQIFYVFAMAANPMLAAPLISAYCIVSLILGHIIIKERLYPGHYCVISICIAGIIMLGISEGLTA